MKYILLALVFPFMLGFSQLALSQQVPAPKEREAWAQASHYSVDHSVVAFAVYGHAIDASNAEMVRFIIEVLGERNIQTKPFTGDENELGAAFSFYIKGHQHGPVGLDELLAMLDDVGDYYFVEYPELRTQPLEK